MEVVTQKIIRYIELRFEENDLKKLSSDISEIEEFIKKDFYNKDKISVMKNLLEFKAVINSSLYELTGNQ